MRVGQLLWACAFLCSLKVIVGYPGGAPASACMDMLPEHSAKPQNTMAPFSLSMPNMTDSESVIGIDDRVTLNLEVANSNQTFKGLLLQARQVNGSSNQVLGTFYINAAEKDIKYLTCGDEGINNAVTHSNKNPKTSIKVEWLPDDDFEGDVEFVATIVKEYSTFWVSVKSEPFSVAGNAPPGVSALSSLVVLILGALALLK